MLVIIAPAKKLDFSYYPINNNYTIPEYINYSEELVKKIRNYNPFELSNLMNISIDLAELNLKRYSEWHLPFTKKNSKEAILAFNGEVFQKLKAKEFSQAEFEFAQDNLFILSGLYGILRPFDLIQPYRLEMGISFPMKNTINLYEFWNGKITDSINRRLEERNKNIIINLASQEYFKAVNEKKLKAKIVTPVFKEFRNGEYKTIFIYVKQARGMMCNFIIKNRIENPEELKFFDKSGYHFDANLSTNNRWVFTR